MGILYDDVVMIRQSEKEGEPKISDGHFTVLVIFFLDLCGADMSTDGKWCYIVFWVIGKPNTRWGLLKKRLMGVCPSCSSASGILFYQSELQPPKPPDVFLLKFCCRDRRGLLHDVTVVLCELELTIKRVKVSTTPDGRVMDLFFITDTREQMHTKKRQDDTHDYLQDVLGDAMLSCEIEMVGPEITACSQGHSFLPPAITDDKLNSDIDERQRGSPPSSVSIDMDNSLSPSHTLVQIVCQDHKGLLYDLMRILKDYNIQISYGRFTTKQTRKCEMDLFIMQADGKKIVDPNKQDALCSRIRRDLVRSLRVSLVSRGPDTELLVANPVELSGMGRPLVFHDITLALKILNTGIFSAEIGRHMIGDREWEVYRVLLDETDGSSVPQHRIEEAVWKMLMGWE
ncbi:hypothetical protein C3L33_02614, partial [Rhododendron williamsianum]